MFDILLLLDELFARVLNYFAYDPGRRCGLPTCNHSSILLGATDTRGREEVLAPDGRFESVKQEDIALWVQVAAVLAAVAAAIVALVISALDRRNARQIAAEDRRAALEHSQLLFEQTELLRLLQNLRRGGHTDPDKIKDMGAEAGAIIGVIGPERLPRNWEARIAKNADELHEVMEDESEPGWLRRSVEVQLALNDVTREIREQLAGR